MVGHAPDRVTTDGHDSYPRAIREMIGNNVVHRTNAYLNNRIEQDHRGIKQRYYPLRGFGSFASASHFCRAFDARSPVLPGTHHDETIGVPGGATSDIPPTPGSLTGNVPHCLNLETLMKGIPTEFSCSQF
ncbi:hypothetical protein KSF_103520 [Reticulibacter mediterranei]|uniref:DDE domain-containing protein n=1 Tax=Reticulibacter mediterranei TaxID=2778369 RepID=A0A8J3IQV5_9CHLR|nr:hypothetical protein KSF_103520 [Reticulibacter mediterranei]